MTVGTEDSTNSKPIIRGKSRDNTIKVGKNHPLIFTQNIQLYDYTLYILRTKYTNLKTDKKNRKILKE